MGAWINLTGRTFGKLTAISYLGSSKWLCRCSCGVEKTVHSQALREGRTTSCGTCKSRVKPNMQFGRLTTVEKFKRSGKTHWKCICSCNNLCEVSQSDLVTGNTKSCGCLNRELSSQRKTKHGLSDTRLHRIWSGIFTRCENPAYAEYYNYGGRGISICDEWREFLPFYEWAMSHGYSDGLTLDRIDGNGNYCPENCRWATPKEQSNNTRRNVHITYNGLTMNATQWEEKLGLRRGVVADRKRKGWSDIECIEGRRKK